MTDMSCAEAELRISEHLDGVLPVREVHALETHLSACAPCRERYESIEELLESCRRVPRHRPPDWLAARILARTPRRQRETWRGTLAGVSARILETRTATALFTAAVMLAWMLDLVGVPLDMRQLASPRAIYYAADDMAADSYDKAMRVYQQASVVREIRSGLERLRADSE